MDQDIDARHEFLVSIAENQLVCRARLSYRQQLTI
jgi:hypothetical protein